MFGKIEIRSRKSTAHLPFEQVAYPIENGVPVLLAEKAETLKE